MEFMDGKLVLCDTSADDVAVVTSRLAPECLRDVEDVINSGVSVMEFSSLVYAHADICKTLFIAHKPVMICGIVQAYPDRIDTGFFFMFFTETMKKYPLVVARHSYDVLAEFISSCKYDEIISTVHPDNTQSIKWARSLGAAVVRPENSVGGNGGKYYLCVFKCNAKSKERAKD